jgi:hypothetical protein
VRLEGGGGIDTGAPPPPPPPQAESANISPHAVDARWLLPITQYPDKPLELNGFSLLTYA